MSGTLRIDVVASVVLDGYITGMTPQEFAAKSKEEREKLIYDSLRESWYNMGISFKDASLEQLEVYEIDADQEIVDGTQVSLEGAK